MNSLPRQNVVPPTTLPSAVVSQSAGHANEDAPDYAFKGFPYDMEDIGLDAAELQAKYVETGEHDFHSRVDWRGAVARSGNKLEYWDWVLTQIAIDDENY
ncbi:hypothetical protein [Pseudomonas sp. NPDC089569]|uniref:hypothetical protein n=1 Tax=Pseudomonas sp. NPDC089569 TaxID=3390722 RepID=UPI003CFD0480